jgi:hypothetical protein
MPIAKFDCIDEDSPLQKVLATLLAVTKTDHNSIDTEVSQVIWPAMECAPSSLFEWQELDTIKNLYRNGSTENYWTFPRDEPCRIAAL